MKATTPRFRALPALALAMLAAAPVFAGATRAVRDAGFELLKQGDLASTQLDSDGFVTPGYARKTVGETGTEIVWDLVREDGGAILCATGHKGRLVRLEAGKPAKIVGNIHDPEMTALGKIPGGPILAAGAPTGEIFRVNTDDTLTTLTELEANIVWRMIPDGEGGVWAATGPEGKLFRVHPEKTTAKVEQIADLKSTNLLDLWLDKEGLLGVKGALIVAGQNPGWLYRVVPGSKKTEMLYNAEAEEIRAIAPVKDGLVMALNTDRSPTAKAFELTYRMSGNSPDRPDGAPPVAGLSGLADALKPGGGGFGPPRSELVLLTTQGFRRQLWVTEQRPIHAVAAAPDGRDVLVAVGGDGNLARISVDGGAAAVVADAREDFLLRIVREGDDYLIGTARNGSVIQMETAPRDKAVYVSRAIDAGAPVRWGKAWWQGRLASGQSARASFRVGNDGDVDEGQWGEWTGAEKLDPQKSVALPEKVARYLQYKLELEGAAAPAPPRSDYMEVFYALPNAAPLIRNVTAAEAETPAAGAPPAMPGGKGPKSGGPPSGPVPAGGRDPRSNAMHVKVDWQAMDPANDTLEYAVWFRASDEEEWKKIEDDIKDMTLTIESGGVADGRYRFRVIASDKDDNPPGQALEAAAVSNEITIDNTPPVIGAFKISVDDDAAEIRFEVRDAASQVSAVRVDCDNGDVALLAPADGLYDDRAEDFVYHSGKKEIGEHVATFNCTDRRGNTTIGRAVFRIK